MSAASFSSVESLPVVFGHDGKARMKPSHRISTDLTQAFPGVSLSQNGDNNSNGNNGRRGSSLVNGRNDDYDYIGSYRSNFSNASNGGIQFQSRGSQRDEELERNSRSEISGSRPRSIRFSFSGESNFSIGEQGDMSNSTSRVTPKQYADELRQFTEISSPNSSFRKHTKDDSLQRLLVNLREELEGSSRFVDDFVSSSINGQSTLIRLLIEIQRNLKDQGNRGVRRWSKEVAPPSDVTLELCLRCLEEIIRHKQHLNRFLDDGMAVESVASCCSLSADCCIASMELMMLVCDMDDIFYRMIDDLSRANSRAGELGRLNGYVRLLNKSENISEKATIVRFLNRLWRSAPNLMAKLFLQQELQLADFRPEALAQLCASDISREAELLQQEIETWTENSIDDSALTSTSHISELERSNTTLGHQIEQLRDILKESENKNDLLEETRQQLEIQCDAYRERVKEQQEKEEQFKILYYDRTGRDVENDFRTFLNQNTKSLHGTIQRNFARQNQLRQGTLGFSQNDAFQGRRPLSPSFLRKSIRLKITSHQHLVQLNWTPLNAIGSTIFEDMDIEAAIREMDFTELDRIFQLSSKMDTVDAKDRAERMTMLKNAKRISFVENNRAKNLVITQRKTGLNPLELKLAIDSCDVSSLPGENAEMLLKYTPTREELQSITTHGDHYEDFDDAERVLFQMSRVERLEMKLSVMVFIGLYRETISRMKPSIEILKKASQSVIDSDRLKGVLEVILVYGNYMNCTRRGCALGFRLDSLSKLSEAKSRDKKLTLLHHLQSVLLNDFPLLATFYEDLCLEDIKSVSLQVIDEGFVALRKGIDIVNDELQHQPDNLILSRFYEDADVEIAALEKPYREMVTCYRFVCNLFGENFRIVEPSELFGHLVDFIAAFKKASIENLNRLNSLQTVRQVDSPETSRSSSSKSQSSNENFKSALVPNKNEKETANNLSAREKSNPKRSKSAANDPHSILPLRRNPSKKNSETKIARSSPQPTALSNNNRRKDDDQTTTKRESTASGPIRLGSHSVYYAAAVKEPSSSSSSASSQSPNELKDTKPENHGRNQTKETELIETKEVPVTGISGDVIGSTESSSSPPFSSEEELSRSKNIESCSVKDLDTDKFNSNDDRHSNVSGDEENEEWKL